jgi:hypothetical protein
MKTEKIEELYNSNQTEYSSEGEISSEMLLSDFTNAINQVEKENKLEWYKKLESHLSQMIERENFAYGMRYYYEGIKNKIKELEK